MLFLAVILLGVISYIRLPIDLLPDVSDNISPGLKWPPAMTTICPLGPSAVSPIVSAVERFRHEFEHYVEHGRPIDGVHRPSIPGSGVAAHA